LGKKEEGEMMLIEPANSFTLCIKATPPNPDWDEGIRLSQITVREETRKWVISVGLYGIIIDYKGQLFINGDIYKKPEKKRVKTRKTVDHYVR
jgi:hypothetical protein